MVGHGGADVEVVRDGERLVELLEHASVLVTYVDGLAGRRHGLGRALDLLAVLVTAREEEDAAPLHAVVARDHIGGDGLVGVAHVRRAIRVVDGRRDVELLGGRELLSLLEAACGKVNAKKR